MTKYLAGVLSVIAVGVLLIAYGLLSPRVGAFASPADFDPFARPVLASEQGMMRNDPYTARYGYGNPYTQSPYGFNYPEAPQPQPVAVREVRPVRTVTTTEAPRQIATRVEPRRDWKKTALIIGGSTAGAAGIGGIFGGKKGALIGAAIGGGASTIYEATKKPAR
jgi:hypothetical protein